MLTPKSRAGKSGAAPVKSRAAKVRTANAAKPRSVKVNATPGPTPELVVAGVSAVAVSEPAPVFADSENAAGSGAQESGPIFKKKHLIERVHALSGAKKRDIKDIVEATLAAISEALASGDMLNLPPLGKLTVNRQKDLASGDMMIVKIRRQPTDKKPGKDPLADIDEDG